MFVNHICVSDRTTMHKQKAALLLGLNSQRNRTQWCTDTILSRLWTIRHMEEGICHLADDRTQNPFESYSAPPLESCENFSEKPKTQLQVYEGKTLEELEVLEKTALSWLQQNKFDAHYDLAKRRYFLLLRVIKMKKVEAEEAALTQSQDVQEFIF